MAKRYHKVIVSNGEPTAGIWIAVEAWKRLSNPAWYAVQMLFGLVAK